MEIKIQNYYWFSNSVDEEGKHGNVFSGSVGTDSSNGFMNTRTFEYRVHLAMKDEAIVFFVDSWVLPEWASGKGKVKENEETVYFDNNEDSVPLIEKHLTDRMNELLG